jgi:voltage-gated potassium channel
MTPRIDSEPGQDDPTVKRIDRLRDRLGANAPVVLAFGRTSWARQLYDWVMVGLAVAVAWMLTLPDHGWVRTANWVIWAIFAADFVLRLLLSRDRRAFFRPAITNYNLYDLVAVIPLPEFRLARLARLGRLARLLRMLRLLRAGSTFARATADMRGVLGTNGLNYALAIALGAIVVGAITVWAVEDALATFPDALWWSIVTATTVGYGDIAPTDPFARVVAVALMLIGIGTLGMVTGSIATYFIKDHDPPAPDSDLNYVREHLDQWQALTVPQRLGIIEVLRQRVHDRPPPSS